MEHRTHPSRRDFIQVGGLSALGLSLQSYFTQRALAETISKENSASSPRLGRAKSCILIWLDGGPTHLETFDPKPLAPREVRGPFGAISTNVDGIQISELLPQTAALMQHSVIIRSMTSPLGEHNFGTHYLLTGYKPTPALNYPAIGSVVSHLADNSSSLPSHVAIPDMRVGGGKFVVPGYLPTSVAPFEVGGDPAKPDFRVRDLSLFPGIVDERVQRRREFLLALDSVQADAEQSSPSDPAFEKAYRLMTSTKAKRAFDLSLESSETTRRYGGKSIGQCCLLARRLVEAGVPFVTVNNRGWDTHENLVTRLRDGFAGAREPVGLIPSLDMAYASLITDLHDRGLLDETLVVVMGEFGRTPKLNTAGGRDHWPRVFSVMMAGGGIPGGQLIGASDPTGESAMDRPVTPADLAATIYSLLGIDLNTTLQTPDARPVKIVQSGTAIQELLS